MKTLSSRKQGCKFAKFKTNIFLFVMWAHVTGIQNFLFRFKTSLDFRHPDLNIKGPKPEIKKPAIENPVSDLLEQALTLIWMKNIFI